MFATWESACDQMSNEYDAGLAIGFFPAGIFPAELFPAGIFSARAFPRRNFPPPGLFPVYPEIDILFFKCIFPNAYWYMNIYYRL